LNKLVALSQATKNELQINGGNFPTIVLILECHFSPSKNLCIPSAHQTLLIGLLLPAQQCNLPCIGQDCCNVSFLPSYTHDQDVEYYELT